MTIVKSLLLIAVAIAGIGSLIAADSMATEPISLCGTTWVVTHLNGDPVLSHAPTLLLEGERASGRGGCNRYTATIELGKKGSLHFGPIAATRMACLGDSGKREEEFFRGLAATSSYHLNRDYLVLLDGHFNKLIEFQPLCSTPTR